VVWLAAGLTFAGDLTGHISITKTLTRKRVSLPSYDAERFTADGKQPDRSVDELGRVVVWLEGGELPRAQPETAVLAQHYQRFQPEIVVIPAGSMVSFPNQDPIFHNVFSLSHTKSFDLGYYPQGHSRSVEFKQAGVVQVYCHLHPNMYGAIVVVPSRMYARPGQDGGFTMTSIPAGTYQLVAWHASAGFFRRRVRVPESGALTANFVIPVRNDQDEK
jgi:plastocyanin